MFCNKHKLPTMVDVKNKKCESCNKQAAFNILGLKNGRFCLTHKTDDMVDVKSKRCAHVSCNTKPSFNIFGGRPKFCFLHKLEGMVDVNHPLCEAEKCETRPSYNLRGMSKPRFCAKHKEADMIIIYNTTCEMCDKSACFNIKGAKDARFCLTHKEEGMVDVVHQTCEKCDKRPAYNHPGEKTGRFCTTHKEANMINVESPTCEKSSKTHVFNLPGNKRARFCLEHKEENMINIRMLRCEKCDTTPLFNFKGEQPRFCLKHKEPTMVDTRHKLCKLCNDVRSRPKFDNMCFRCFLYTNPDSPKLRFHRTKERNVVDFLRENTNVEWVLDKKIAGGSSQRRPDIFCAFEKFNMIIEVDENQHEAYDCVCENKRIMQLFVDGGSLPIVCIRFNPDKYVDHNGKSISTCWGTTEEKGLCKVKKTKIEEWKQRLAVLKTTVDLVLNSEVHKEIDVIHLFYDGYA